MREVKRIALERKILFIRMASILLPLAIALLLLSQNVSAQTTYVITDGSRVLVHTTSETDPKIVLGEAGLKLGEDDTYTTQASDGISEINIRRNQQLTIDYYGRQIEATSQGETVEDLLHRLNLDWGGDDIISVALDTQTYDGMKLTVAHVVRENQSYTMVLAHKTIYCDDPALPAGTERMLTEGVDGQLLCEAEVTYINGIEAERKVLCQQVVSQPVSEVIAVGTGIDDGSAQEEESLRPVIGERTITLPTGEVLTYTKKMTCLATAYHCEGYVGKTATGTRARVGAIAVDPKVFPYGTRFYIMTQDGEYIYGIATAEDCGDKRFIHDTRLDLFFDTKYECVQFGARNCDVYILG